MGLHPVLQNVSGLQPAIHIAFAVDRIRLNAGDALSVSDGVPHAAHAMAHMKTYEYMHRVAHPCDDMPMLPRVGAASSHTDCIKRSWLCMHKSDINR